MNYLTLFFSFLKIGIFALGGGYAMLPLLQQEVLSHGWLSHQELINEIGLARALPGVFGLNLSVFVGYGAGKLAGALTAVAGMLLPTALLALALMKWMKKSSGNSLVRGVLDGVKPATVGLVAAAALTALFSSILGGVLPASLLYYRQFPQIDWRGGALVLLVFVLGGCRKKGRGTIPPALLLVLAGVLSCLLHLIR